MSSNDYKKRLDMINDFIVHIDCLIKDNTELHLQLDQSEAHVDSLKVEVTCLQDGQITRSLELDESTKGNIVLTEMLVDANNEISRLSLVIRHQADNYKTVQSLRKKTKSTTIK